MSLVITQTIWLPPIFQELVDQVYAIPKIALNRHLITEKVESMYVTVGDVVRLHIANSIIITITAWGYIMLSDMHRSGMIISRENLIYNGVDGWGDASAWQLKLNSELTALIDQKKIEMALDLAKLEYFI